MASRPGWWVALAGVLAVVLVAVGVGVAVAMSADRPPAGAEQSTAPSASPSSTPASDPAPVSVRPERRVMATCDELVPAAAEFGFVDATDVAVIEDEPSIVAVQAGQLECAWSAPWLADQAISLHVIPDAAPLGDVDEEMSGPRCSTGAGVSCGHPVEAPFFAYIWVQFADDMTLDAANAAFDTILESARVGLASATILPRLDMPRTLVPGVMSALDFATVGPMFGLTSGAGATPGWPQEFLGSTASDVVGVEYAAWGDSDGGAWVQAQVIPGAGWAVDELLAQAGVHAPLEVAGFGVAASRIGSHSVCGAVGVDLVCVWGYAGEPDVLGGGAFERGVAQFVAMLS